MVIVLFLTLASSVHAHRIHLFAWVEGDTVYTESHFGTKKKIKGGLIKVYDLSGNKLLEGKTDEKGEFSFRFPKNTDLQIVLEDTLGHRAEYVLKASEPLRTGVRSDSFTKKSESQTPSSSVVQVDLDQISMVVEKALDSKLKPIVKTLAKIQEKRGPGFPEVLAGIGYILGLLGLILYIKSKRKR
jgi:nickel transport protein